MNYAKVACFVFSLVTVMPISAVWLRSCSNNMIMISAGIISYPITPIRAIWLDNRYLYGSSPVQTVAQAKDFLNSIGNPNYVYVRPARVDSGNPAVVDVMTLNFASLIHPASNRTKVLAIVNVVTDDPSNEIYCDLSIQSNRDTLMTTMAQVINNDGFDGAIFDIEPLASGTTWLPQMVQQLKALTAGKTMIVYSFALVDDSQAGGYEWSSSYLKSVASVADYVEIRLYNFGAQTADMYKARVSNQVERIKLAGLFNKTLFVLPCYPASSIHDPLIENIANAGPIVQQYNTGLYSQTYMTQNDYTAYLSYFSLHRSS